MDSIGASYRLVCFSCGKENDERKTTTYCVFCGSVLTVKYNKLTPRRISYPLKTVPKNPLYFNYTPLVPLHNISKKYGLNVYAKLDFHHITGCFKDRGSFVEVLKAVESESSAIALASTGNMAASVACYAAYYNIKCYVFIPEKTSTSKLAQAIIYGAHIIRINGDFNSCERICALFAKKYNCYIAGDFVFREEGQKSMSYELYEQNPSLFDYVCVPIGCGTNFSAIYKGFDELRQTDLISHVPKLVAIQPEESSPVVEGLQKGRKIIKAYVKTIASSVAIANPIDFCKVMNAVDVSGGFSTTVKDHDILLALQEITMEEGFYIETACAMTWAATKKHIKTFKNKSVLLVFTGTGLKEPHNVTENTMFPPVLDGNLDDIVKFVNSGFYALQEKSWPRHLFSKGTVPLDSEHLKLYQDHLKKFKARGKTLSTSEIETLYHVINSTNTKTKKILEIVDYNITMQKKSPVKADLHVVVQKKEQRITATANGAINALLKALVLSVESVIALKVIDHTIDIIQPDIDSLVVVTLTLSSENTIYYGRGISTDTLEAIIQAFCNGVHEFYTKQVTVEEK